MAGSAVSVTRIWRTGTAGVPLMVVMVVMWMVMVAGRRYFNFFCTDAGF